MKKKNSEKVVLYAVISVAVLAFNDKNKDAIRESGLLQPVIQLLRSTKEDLIEKACASLLNLSLNQPNRVEIRKLDGIAPLIELLFHHNPNIQQNAAGVLWNLSNDPQNKRVIQKLGGLSALLTLIGGGSVQPKKTVIPPKSERNDEDEDDLEGVGGKAKSIDDSDDEEMDSVLGKSKYVDDSDEEDENKLRSNLEKFATELLGKIDDKDGLGKHLTKKDKKLLKEKIDELLDWLDDNPKATAAEIKARRKKFMKDIKPVLKRVYARKEFKEYCDKLKDDLTKDPSLKFLTENEKEKIEDLIEDALEWLKKNEDESLDKIIERRKKLAADVDPLTKRSKKLADLEDYANGCRSKLENEGYIDLLNDKERKVLENKSKDVLDWIDENGDADIAKIELKKKDLEDSAEPVMVRLDAHDAVNDYVVDLKNRLNDGDLSKYGSKKDQQAISE